MSVVEGDTAACMAAADTWQAGAAGVGTPKPQTEQDQEEDMNHKHQVEDESEPAAGTKEHGEERTQLEVLQPCMV